jgi:hypothetical protein
MDFPPILLEKDKFMKSPITEHMGGETHLDPLVQPSRILLEISSAHLSQEIDTFT